MARVVGATPEQLRDAGRQDAADELIALDHMREGRGLASVHPPEPFDSTTPSATSSTFLDGIVQRARAIEGVGEMVFGALDNKPNISADTKAELALVFANISIDLAELLLPRIEDDRAFITPYAEATIALRKFVELHDYYAPDNKLASQAFYHGIRDMERGNLIEQTGGISEDLEAALEGSKGQEIVDPEQSDNSKQNPGLHRVTKSRLDRDLPGTDPTANNAQTGSNTTGSGDQVPSDAAAAEMTDVELKQAAAADPLWADYIKTKRPELVDWDF